MQPRRDPATDPQPGDTFVRYGAKHRPQRRIVLTRLETRVVYVQGGVGAKAHEVWLTTFQDWARSADLEPCQNQLIPTMGG